ncbi:MAG: 3-hydroxybutyryl-CoA dehydrogenase, partial [Solirubrobacterales bacterium]|nr:3-hydroxybutyryl-CoA dehydrogenase [Solirubrobacterales bacterium]
MSIERVAVLGGGLMGSGIAEVSAAHGFAVALRDIDDRALDSARGRIETSLARGVKSGKLTGEAAEETLERIRFTLDLDDLADADLVIEAVPEQVELKVQVLSDVAAVVGGEALIASNTSSIPIAQLAATIPDPRRVLGL